MGRKPTIIVVVNRNLLYLGVLVLSFFFGWWLYYEPVIKTNLPLSSTISGKKIVIDAGHGGIDPGTRSKDGLLEKDLNLDIALKLKRHLAMVGVHCIMIRETDRDFSDSNQDFSTKKRRDLSYRTRTANQSKADLYLSIHANSFPQSIYRGAQTFFEKPDSNSKYLAEAIQKQFIKRLKPNRRRVKAGDYRVLNDTTMPGVMIEVGFLSNPDEAKLLADGSYREQVAKAIFLGIVDYFSNPRQCPTKQRVDSRNLLRLSE